MNKKILFLLCLILFIVSVSAVSASDLNDTVILEDSSNSFDDLQSVNDVELDDSSSHLTVQEDENDTLADDGGGYVNASEAYVFLNKFRQEKGAWYWLSDDVSKAYFNTIDTNQLQPLMRSEALEETAKIRAKEASVLFSHDRPDGTSCYTAFPDTPSARGECLARYYVTCEDAIEGLKETYYNFDGQGHRRLMLDVPANCVGIAGYKDSYGNIYWALDMGIDFNYALNDAEPICSAINLDAPDVVKGLNDSTEKFVITLTNNTAPISNAEIMIDLDGTNYTRVTDDEGKVIMDLNFDVGTYKAIVTYGDIAATTKIEIIPITLLAPDVEGVYGDTELIITLINKSAPISDGLIRVFINSYQSVFLSTNSDGIAKISFNDLDAGVYDMEVTYDYVVYKSTKITVNKRPTEINSFELKKLSRNGFSLTASITPVISSGEMVFVVNGKNYTASINDSKASMEFSDLPAGDYSCKVFYSGDKNYESSSSLIVNNFTSEDYRMSLDVANVTMDYGGNERLVAQLSDNEFNSFSNRDVLVNIDGVSYTMTTDDNGVASMSIDLNSGIYDVVVSYGNVSTNARVTVNQLNTKTTLVSTKGSHNSYTLKASVTPSTVSGIVVFNVNGTEYAVNISGSEAICTLTDLDVGPYSVNASYGGDANHMKSESNSVSFKIDEIIIDVDAQDLTKYYKGSERFVVTVKENDVPLANRNVSIIINGKTYIRTTDNNGVASMAINLDSGKYDATVEYDGIKAYSTVTVNPTIVAKDFTKIFRNNTQYYGEFRNSDGSLLRNTDVKFNINGVFYTRTTNDQGVAKMNINLNPGSYILTATNPTNGEMQSVTITVLSSIVENYDLTKYYKNDSQYRIRLLDSQGNPVGAGVSVEFNINGVFYTRTSDAQGYVKMNINLNPGTYIITANYNGLMASNTIKVLPIIKAEDLVMSYRDGSKFEATLLDGQGKPYANQNMTFNINGVFYTRPTDDNGIARLNINLMDGEYIITSMYGNGAATSNKVTIRS
ncbi:MAG: Ig-like domain repeat protein [Methanobrevibacter sp.]|uniref:Ig-like domain repeat protein n=1 Tax=Methanobrevibacter sp. TaxID=66852 RepID=UPI001B1F4785|nr:Ig-like domain repeat protein [Methanobrevibacter sp.]MBO5151378.1 Ig-like domain repeat protein [Methanobrevibacter sp.]